MKIHPNGSDHASVNSVAGEFGGRRRNGSAVSAAVIAWVATGLLLAAEIVAIAIVAFPARASAAPSSAHLNRVGALSLDRCTVAATRPSGPVTRTRSFSDDFRQEVLHTTVILDAC
ncbi:hypothetical protein GCM10023114_40270 [Mycolicibacterium sediminis]|uniref:Uncharacterized protein n=1 Tax=Mycolicibacterium sediminis TaxID=1286180 RepID=A0A7I7QVJ6_9MYCO|nr:hypothetical protein MSEDJ_44640 [Mycolicibacterium sediminis]